MRNVAVDSAGGSASKKGHKNVLLIVADDLGLYLGCYGTPKIQTHAIDTLADEGTRFTNAFASTASCSGSRSTIYTGLHTHQNGQYGLEGGRNHFHTYEWVETAPLLFNTLGYQTGIIGKVHVGIPSTYSWEVREESDSRDTRWVSQRAAAFFDKALETDRPFHLTIGWRDPHRDNTREDFGNQRQEVIDAGLQGPGYSTKDVEIKEYMTDLPEVRTELVNYYNSITRMDWGTGWILEALQKRGLDKSTLVVFVSDNGAPFINSKTTMYESGIRLPLIIRQPGQKAGVVNPNMVSFLDILPTCLAWAGRKDDLKTPISYRSPKRLGDSILPILNASEILPAHKWKQHVFGSHTFHEVSNYWPTRYLRTHRYKYHRNIAYKLDFPFAGDLYYSLSWEGYRNQDGPVKIGKRPLQDYIFRTPESLYDLEKDPEEVHNLAYEDEYQDLVKEFRGKMEAWQYETRDSWLYRDGIAVVTLEHFMELGLEVPDRWEFDPKNPGSKHVPIWHPPKSK
ncbi:alkaline-phosphatase-like protein [Neohortaea acidophila]|uniref:Alkaline-phosphatase-like protein n=1 Tax=Neohortaea acidophila TaxID=245834 RepID=A0A6A6PMK3_9PEZI|nr:alkaline-phosphatase-like protein [Neohortaea acidophila]KAF2480921.1 alkaline-phosphatase-like protein [Neohortaea acidophila]